MNLKKKTNHAVHQSVRIFVLFSSAGMNSQMQTADREGQRAPCSDMKTGFSVIF